VLQHSRESKLQPLFGRTVFTELTLAALAHVNTAVCEARLDDYHRDRSPWPKNVPMLLFGRIAPRSTRSLAELRVFAILLKMWRTTTKDKAAILDTKRPSGAGIVD